MTGIVEAPGSATGSTVSEGDVCTLITPVEGMSCAACASAVEKRLSAVDGVHEASVNFSERSVLLRFDKNRTGVGELRDTLSGVGFTLVEPAEEQETNAPAAERPAREREFRRKLMVAVVCSVPVFIISMFMIPVPYAEWIMLFLSIPVVFYSGRDFYTKAFKMARNGQASMDSLVALGTGAAFGLSAFITVYPGFLRGSNLEFHVYYEAAVVIITLVLLGRYLEERARLKTSDAIQKLLDLSPPKARLVRNGEERSVALEQVRRGDILRIVPGDKIPVDGQVVEGRSGVNESMISGESLPVDKGEGDTVLAGTMNLDGSFLYRAERVGRETVLAGIIEQVRKAQNSKAPIQSLADRVSGFFVPVVMIIAAVAFAAWLYWGPEPQITYAFVTALAVLVIACPCALGLATPTAISVGIGKGAAHGVLIRDAESLERAGRIKTLLVDKTGTLTRGEPEVGEIVWYLPAEQRAAAESSIAAIERRSEHPLAQALCRRFSSASRPETIVDEFAAVGGSGVMARIGAQRYLLGNSRIVQTNGGTISAAVQADAARLEQAGNTLVYVARGGSVIALIAVRDPLRPGAAEAVAAITTMGIDVVMLTGDNDYVAAAVADALGIKRYQARMLPEDKAAYVGSLRLEAGEVGMVGDGINDAPALAEAGVSFAMGSGTDVAMESAGITLMKGDLKHLVTALRLSRRTLRVIRQNLFWAFFYNLLGIPVAAGVLYPAFGFLLNPMLAGAAMAFSSLSVVGNSLRLKRAAVVPVNHTA